jgi:uncharacterized protein YjiS (DUF1127 family)
MSAFAHCRVSWKPAGLAATGHHDEDDVMFVGHWIATLRTWFRYREGVRMLSSLSDLQLSDIGLSRSEITGIAWRAARSTGVQPASGLRGD